MDNGGYQVHHSRSVGEAFRQLQQQATDRGQGKAFIRALRRIIRALRNDPSVVGEPLYRLKGLRLQVRTVVVAPLAIEFAVSEDHPLVWLKSGVLLFPR